MSRLHVNLKNPCKKPRQYTDSIESLAKNQGKGVIAYDFCSIFEKTQWNVSDSVLLSHSGIESATTPPENVQDDLGSVSQEGSTFDGMYVQLPKSLYDKIMQLAKAKGLGKESKSKKNKNPKPVPQWNEEEDRILMDLVKIHGKKDWNTVASELGTSKTAKACRDRYHSQIDPHVKRGDWSPQEDDTIIELHKTLGNQWTKIAKLMKGRTANTIKNRWHGYLKKQFLNSQPAPQQENSSTTQGRSSNSGINAQPMNGNSISGHSDSFSGQSVHDYSDSLNNKSQIESSKVASFNQPLLHNMSSPISSASPSGISSASPSAITEDPSHFQLRAHFPNSNSAMHATEVQPFSNEFANNFYTPQEHVFKLDSNGEICSETSSEFGPSDSGHFFAISPSPKRKRETESFFVVGKRIKMETPPDNLDLNTLYADDGEDFADPLHFEVYTPVNGSGKRDNHFELSIDIPKDEEYQNQGQTRHVYPTGNDKYLNHYNSTYDILSFSMSPSHIGSKDMILWSPKSTSEILNTSHSPSKHFLKLGSHL